MIWPPFSLAYALREVLPDLPVERGLEGVLDRERSALDEEHVLVHGMGDRDAAERLDELGHLRGVDVGIRRLVQRGVAIRSRNSGLSIFGWLYPIGHEAKFEKKSSIFRPFFASNTQDPCDLRDP
jgi:hypothetical protein